ncbi:MAG: HAMP domain-containing histidine kinase [Eubacterium sp.]|nr:HAMP domain-containing histidine kinase [Eubacterium sp.]
MVCVVAGFILFSFWSFRRTVWLMENILGAVNRIYREKEELVELPQELHEVEKELNQVMLNVRASREKAEEAEQRKNDLIIYMAHDLKTPLTSVIGYLSLLEEEKDISGELKQKYLGIALKKSQRLEELVNEFFEITRFNLSTMTLELSTVNLTRMLEQISSEFIPVFQEKDLTYHLELDSDLKLLCDIDKMERVFDNLLKNAVNYSYKGTQIRILAHVEQQQGSNKEKLHIQIINHGKTIPKEKQERIFEQFFRLESSRGSGTGGAGLGLAIAREIIEQHGGELTCESEDEQIIFHIRMACG